MSCTASQAVALAQCASALSVAKPLPMRPAGMQVLKAQQLDSNPQEQSMWSTQIMGRTSAHALPDK